MRSLVRPETISSRGVQSSSARQASLILQICLLVLLTVAVRLPWIFMIPISEAPDEGAHLWTINFIFNHLRLPERSDMILEPAASYYGACAPLCYSPHVLCAALMPWVNSALAFRFGSLLMSVASVLAAFYFGCQLFSNSRILAIALPLYMVFHPQFVFVGTYSNNDIGTCFVATMLMAACLLGIKNGITQKLAIVLGVVSGLLLLCKPTGYCMFPMMLIALCLSFWSHRTPLRSCLARIATIGSLAALISAPFFLKNWFKFNKDFFGMNTMLELWWQSYGKPDPPFHWPIVDNRDWRWLLFISYFGNFGNMNRLLPGRIYKYYSLAINLALIGWSLVPIMAIILPKIGERIRRLHLPLFRGVQRLTEFDPKSALLWAVPFLCLVFNFLAVVMGSASLNSTGPPQGKYLFPAEAAMAALFVGGLDRLGGRYLVGLFLSFNAISCLISFSMLYSLYHFDVNIFR